MKTVIAIDSFKGSISSADAALAVRRGVLNVFPQAEVVCIPVADGGEGTVDALIAGLGGKSVALTVTGPLGEPVGASWAALENGTAVIEMASASGLPLVPNGRRDPCVTTTYGTGELIKAALDAGYRRLLIGIGGSATNDGGAGMAQALGVSLKDASGRELGYGGLELSKLIDIDISGLDARLSECEVSVACDVDNPLTGERGASAVYGPQKGATPEVVKRLDAALRNYEAVLRLRLGKDVGSVPGAGAAGGLGAGLLAFCGAVMSSGIELVLQECAVEEAIRGADLVITGEGMMDASSAFGKTPVGVAALAKKHGVPVIALTGCIGRGAQTLYEYGIDAIIPIADRPMSMHDSIANAAALLTSAAERTMRTGRIFAEKIKL